MLIQLGSSASVTSGRVSGMALVLVFVFLLGYVMAEFVRAPFQPKQESALPADATQLSLLRASLLKHFTCRLQDASPTDLAKSNGLEGSELAQAYRGTFKNCWVNWSGSVVHTITWADAFEFVVADSNGGLARLNVGAVSPLSRQELEDRPFVAYSGLITGELDGVPLISYIELSPRRPRE